MSHEPADQIALQDLSATTADPTLTYAHAQDGTDPAKSSATAVSGLAEAHTISRYEIRRELGRGAFGAVYLAYDPRLDREVALKVPRDAASWSAAEVDALLEEARTAAQLKHPHVVTVYDAGLSAEAGVFIAMEYVEGQSLAQVLQNGPLSAAEARRILGQVAQAIHQAHKQGLIHRDLKPSNILLDREGNAKVSDFGLALWEHRQQRHAGEVSGTLAYMSPEQIRGQAHLLDGRSDIWSLGVILYECLGGRKPFRGDSSMDLRADILERDPKPLRQINDRVDSRLDELCRKCLERDIGRRLATGLEFSSALQQESKPSRRAWIPLLLVGCLVGLLALAAVAAMWSGRPEGALPRASRDGPADGNLLRLPPRPIIYDRGSKRSYYSHVETTSQFIVDSPNWSAFACGAHAGDARWDVVSLHDGAPGHCGVFWGLHAEPTADGSIQHACLAVVARPVVGLAHNAELDLYRFTIANDPMGNPRFSRMHDFAHATIVVNWSAPVDMRLIVSAGCPQQVVIQGKEARFTEPSRPMDYAAFSSGECGLLANEHRVIFSRAMILTEGKQK